MKKIFFLSLFSSLLFSCSSVTKNTASSSSKEIVSSRAIASVDGDYNDTHVKIIIRSQKTVKKIRDFLKTSPESKNKADI